MNKFHFLTLSILLLFSALIGVSLRSSNHEVKQSNNEYKVITVQGRIVFQQSGKDMQRGDLYVTGTPLNFETPSARAAIVNSSSGRYVLSSTKGKIKVLPAANNVSSRSGALINVVDLKNHFSDRYLILGTSKVQIGAESFPMNETSFFYLTYEHNGEIIPKKLAFENDKLIFDASDIYKIDGQPIDVVEKEMTLYYKGEKTYKINTFTPVFPNLAELKEEVTILLETLKDADNAKKKEEVTAHLNEFYGSAHKDNLNNWLKTEFNIE